MGPIRRFRSREAVRPSTPREGSREVSASGSPGKESPDMPLASDSERPESGPVSRGDGSRFASGVTARTGSKGRGPKEQHPQATESSQGEGGDTSGEGSDPDHVGSGMGGGSAPSSLGGDESSKSADESKWCVMTRRFWRPLDSSLEDLPHGPDPRHDPG